MRNNDKTKDKPMLRQVTWPEGFAAKGKLFLSSMPGRFEPLEILFREIKAAGVTHVVCLVSDEEIARKSPDYLAAIRANGFPATLWRFEIPDFGMPENIQDLELMLDRIRGRLDAGESVVIHCAAGHGRTGVVSFDASTYASVLGAPRLRAARGADHKAARLIPWTSRTSFGFQ